MLWARSFWITRSTSSRASSLLQGPWWACWLCGSRLAGDALAPIILEHRGDIMASKLAPTGAVVGMLALWEPECRRCFSPDHSGASGRHHGEQARSYRGRWACWLCGSRLAGDAVAPSFWSIGSIASRASSLLQGAVGMLALWEPACRRCCGPGHSVVLGRYHREQARSCRLGVEPGC